MGDITELLVRARDGEAAAFNALFTTLYPDLRRIARARLRQNANGPMQTTALVHETYLKLVAAQRLAPESRGHFLAYAAHVMRSIIVDEVRAAGRQRRGGGQAHTSLDTAQIAAAVSTSADAQRQRVLEIDEALEQLARLDKRLVQVVEMRYFVGMSEAEIAVAMDITDRTVRRLWEKARLLLVAALGP